MSNESKSDFIEEEEWDQLSDSLVDYHSIFSKFWGMGRPRLTESISSARVSFDAAGQAVSWELNPKFWRSLTSQGKIFAIAHESMHVIYSHGVRYKEVAEKYDIDAINAAMDITVNDYLEKSYGFIRNEVEPEGIRYCWLDELLPGEPSGKNFEYYLQKLAQKNPDILAKQDSPKRQEKPEDSEEKGNDDKSESDSESEDESEDNDQNEDGQQEGDATQPGEGSGSGKSSQSSDGAGKLNPNADNANMGAGKNGKQNGGPPTNQKAVKPKEASTVDDHGELGSFKDEGVSKMLDRTTDVGTKQELVKIAGSDVTEKMLASAAQKQQGIMPGSSPGNTFIEFAALKRIKPKPKWESVIKRWTKKALSDEATEMSFVYENRRIDPSYMDGLSLPAEGEGENFEKKKIRVAFFLDTSGSCIHLAERFFNAAKTLDPRRFDVNLYCFDTRVFKTSLKEAKVYGGGGTSFHIIEDAIQQEMAEASRSYPDAVFMITDCYGDKVNPEKPNRWHIFVTEHGDPTGAGCFPLGVNYYHLKNFE